MAICNNESSMGKAAKAWILCCMSDKVRSSVVLNAALSASHDMDIKLLS